MNNIIPKVSIVLPTYNGARYIRQSIDSCLSQTFKDFELIVVDDCSTDDTPQIVKSYRDPRVRYIRNEKNMRLPRALNVGFASARGEFLTWTSDDNFYAPKAIEIMLTYLAEKSCDFVYCDYYLVKEDNTTEPRLIKLPIKPEFHQINPIRCCFLYTRKAMENTGGYDPEMELVEDYDYWIRVSKNFPMHHLAQPLYFYRTHGKSLYNTRTWEMRMVKILMRVRHDIGDIHGLATELTAQMAAEKRRFFKLNRTLTQLIFRGRIKGILSEYKKGKLTLAESKRSLSALILPSQLGVSKPKNIAFIIDGFPVISETFILNQITGLIDNGFNVEIFPRLKIKTDTVHPDVNAYKLPDRTHYVHDIIPLIWLKKAGKAVRLFFMNFHKNPRIFLKSLNVFKYGRDAWNLRYFLYANYFLDKDIIYCHFGTNGRDYIFLKDIFGSRVKYITTFHAYELTKTSFLENGAYNQLFRQGDLFLPVSRHWQNKLVALGCPPQRILVHHMGIDPDQFAFRTPKLDGDEIRLLTVARLVEKKGLEYSIRAAAKVAGQFPKLQYHIAGCGPLRESLETLIKELGMEDHIHLLGPLPTDQVKILMDRAHIYLLTSVTAQDGDQEGIPVSLMEAMAVGLPVISTFHSGIPELIEDGRTGYLVPERNEQAIIEKIKHIIVNRDQMAAIARSGRRRSEEEFNIKKLNKELFAIFDRQFQAAPVDPGSF